MSRYLVFAIGRKKYCSPSPTISVFLPSSPRLTYTHTHRSLPHLSFLRPFYLSALLLSTLRTRTNNLYKLIPPSPEAPAHPHSCSPVPWLVTGRGITSSSTAPCYFNHVLLFLVHYSHTHTSVQSVITYLRSGLSTDRQIYKYVSHPSRSLVSQSIFKEEHYTAWSVNIEKTTETHNLSFHTQSSY